MPCCIFPRVVSLGSLNVPCSGLSRYFHCFVLSSLHHRFKFPAADLFGAIKKLESDPLRGRLLILLALFCVVWLFEV